MSAVLQEAAVAREGRKRTSLRNQQQPSIGSDQSSEPESEYLLSASPAGTDAHENATALGPIAERDEEETKSKEVNRASTNNITNQVAQQMAEFSAVASLPPIRAADAQRYSQLFD